MGLVSGLTTGKRVGMDFLKRKKGLKWGPRGNGFLSDMRRWGMTVCVWEGGEERGRKSCRRVIFGNF